MIESARTKQPWLWPAVLGALALAVTVGLVARGSYQQPPRAATHSVAREPLPSAVTGATTVRMSADAAAHPYGDRVRQVLQAYFDAINAKTYDLWVGVVTAERAQDKPRNQWQRDYRTTQDSDISVYRIERAGEGALRVMLTFISHQDKQAAPADFQHSCVRWRVVFPMTVENGSWKLDAGQTGASPQHAAC